MADCLAVSSVQCTPLSVRDRMILVLHHGVSDTAAPRLSHLCTLQDLCTESNPPPPPLRDESHSAPCRTAVHALRQRSHGAAWGRKRIGVHTPSRASSSGGPKRTHESTTPPCHRQPPAAGRSRCAPLCGPGPPRSALCDPSNEGGGQLPRHSCPHQLQSHFWLLKRPHRAAAAGLYPS